MFFFFIVFIIVLCVNEIQFSTQWWGVLWILSSAVQNATLARNSNCTPLFKECQTCQTSAAVGFVRQVSIQAKCDLCVIPARSALYLQGNLVTSVWLLIRGVRFVELFLTLSWLSRCSICSSNYYTDVKARANVKAGVIWILCECREAGNECDEMRRRHRFVTDLN